MLWAVATITFFLLHLAPGGPFDKDKTLAPEIEKNIRPRLLDTFIVQQPVVFPREFVGNPALWLLS